MGGITGWIDFTRDMKKERSQIEQMTRQIIHRGPDENGYYYERHIGLGHQRLNVMDPDGSQQPLRTVKEGHKYVLTYNGEIYNTKELRAELRKHGWTFDSHSDTEVLLKSYIQWGASHIDKLNGMFAYAIWDQTKEQLFLARDRLGVKPLFFKQHRNGLLFGSEIKTLLAHREIKAVIKEEGLSEVFALGPSRTPGHGVFDSIQELRAGHVGIFNRDGWKTRRYWNVKSTPHLETVEETAETVRTLFMDAVKRQLTADVPVGTFLSGGVDSSAISAIASSCLQKNNQQQPLQTFSIDYIDNDKYFKKSSFQPNQDNVYIEKMADTLQSNHHSFVIDNETLVNLLEEATIHRDLPGMADVDSSLLWFCRQIKQHVTVGLSGEGADEIFGGYPWFYREEDLQREGFPWIRSAEVRQNLLRDDRSNKVNLASYMKNRYEETINETPLLEGEKVEARTRRQMFYLNMHWFMPTLLDRKDRMSMGAGFEARIPFADHRLVEYVWNIPWEIKNYKNREKGILRKALEGILPDDILYRKKSPYPKTHHPLYTKAVIDRMNEILADKEARLFEILDQKKVKQLVDNKAATISAPWYGQLLTGPQLIAHLIQIEYWLKTYNIEIDI